MVDPKAARQASRAAALSLFTNAGLSVLKLSVGYFMRSVSVFADGANSAGDVITSLMAWTAVKQSSQPADEQHRYGHGKFESLSAAIEALVIVVVALLIMWDSARRLIGGAAYRFETSLGLAVMAISALTNLLLSLYLAKVAQRHDSLALRAESLHHRVDVWTSAGVLAGLALIALTGWHFLDPMLAIAIGAVILVQGARVGREAVQQLLDQALPPEEMGQIRALLADHDAMFMDYHRLRARKAGRERQIDLHLVTCPRVTVEEAHKVTEHLEQDISARWPHTRAVIHVEPCDQQSCANRSALDRDPNLCQLKQRVDLFAPASDTPAEPVAAAPGPSPTDK